MTQEEAIAAVSRNGSTDAEPMTPDQVRQYLDLCLTPNILAIDAALTARVKFPNNVERSKLLTERAFTAGKSYYNALSYIEVLRQVEDIRRETGVSAVAHERRSKKPGLREDHAASHGHSAYLLAGQVEAWWNLWSICAHHIHTYASVVARQVKAPTKDFDAVMWPYLELRNVTEHLIEAMAFSGGTTKGPAGFVYSSSTVEEDQIHAVMAWELDEHGQLIVGDLRVDVTSRGLERVEVALGDLLDDVRARGIGRAFATLERHDFEERLLNVMVDVDNGLVTRSGVGREIRD